MFWSTLSCISLASVAFATPLKAADGISVRVVPVSASIDNLESLKFTASVKNNGVDTVKILKYGTILDGNLPTKSFTVSKDGEPINFTGVRISVSLELAGDSAYTVIEPGQSIEVSHSVGSLYDFSVAGVGKYSFEPVTHFTFYNDKGNIQKANPFIKAQVASNAVEVEITGGLEPRKPELLARAEPICDDEQKKSFIASSYSEAKTLAKNAVSYISKNKSSNVLESYFGLDGASQVTKVLNAVAGESSSTRTLNCEDEQNACEPGVIAYTLIKTSNVYYCSIFFDEFPLNQICTSGTGVSKRNVRGGTTLHELTHALSGTDDISYGCEDDQKLSPSKGLANADSYNCFATQVYHDTLCSGSDTGSGSEPSTTTSKSPKTTSTRSSTRSTKVPKATDL